MSYESSVTISVVFVLISGTVFDSKSSVLNTMQSEFLRGIYKKEEEYGETCGDSLLFILTSGR